MKEHELSEIKNSEFMVADHFLQVYINGVTNYPIKLTDHTICRFQHNII